MKKSLLTLTLLVGFSSVVFAADEEAPKSSLFTTLRTKSGEACDSVKNHFSTHGKKWAYGTAGVAGLTGLGFGGHKLYKNPKMVRTAVKSTKRFGRRGLSFVKANKVATIGSTVGAVTLALLVYKRATVKDALSKGWTSFSTGCQNKWASVKGYFANEESAEKL